MSHRFFYDQPLQDGQVVLTGDQAHHATNVMRYAAGDSITLFDGRGTEYVATIDSVSRKKLVASISETRTVARSLEQQITIVVALPKGDRQKFMVEKLVELGVQALIPLRTKRSVAAANAKVTERIGKQVIEASKQCGRNLLMQVCDEATVAELAAKQFESTTIRLLADPYTSETLAGQLSGNADVVVAIGPEGGFDPSEVELLVQAGWKPVQFGPAILRIETAAIAAASLLGIGRIK